MTMENYFKEIKNIIYQLEAISVIILKDLLSLLLFRKILTGNKLLPPFLDLEFKLLKNEMHIKMDTKKEIVGDVLYLKK